MKNNNRMISIFYYFIIFLFMYCSKELAKHKTMGFIYLEINNTYKIFQKYFTWRTFKKNNNNLELQIVAIDKFYSKYNSRIIIHIPSNLKYGKLIPSRNINRNKNIIFIYNPELKKSYESFKNISDKFIFKAERYNQNLLIRFNGLLESGDASNNNSIELKNGIIFLKDPPVSG